jgi:hypothetical protein
LEAKPLNLLLPVGVPHHRKLRAGEEHPPIAGEINPFVLVFN